MVSGGNDQVLRPNLSNSEFNYQHINPMANGFRLATTSSASNTVNVDYIYIAIRRPNKHASEFEPEELFDANTYLGKATTNKITNTVDFAGGGLVWIKYSNAAKSHAFQDTVRGVSTYLFPDLTAAESHSPNTGVVSFDHDGFTVGGTGDVTNQSGGTYWSYSFRRAPGFFDIAAWTGDGVDGREVPHNLGATPELALIKSRQQSRWWLCRASGLAVNEYLRLDEDHAAGQSSIGGPSNEVFVMDDSKLTFNETWKAQTNGSGERYVAYLFASVPGISKVDSYTGTANDIDIDCGFTTGARFVLIKRTDQPGDWVVYDYERGIVLNGMDPYTIVNSNGFSITNRKVLNPYPSGFTVLGNGGGHPFVNANGGQYIYYAIA